MRNARGGALLLDPMLRDLRYAARSLRRDLGATMFSIAIAGLGIGASTTVFGLCQALLLRPLPFREPSRIGRSRAWQASTRSMGPGIFSSADQAIRSESRASP